MLINYPRADRPVIASCFTGNCMFNGQGGLSFNIPEGNRGAFYFDADGNIVSEITEIFGSEALSAYGRMIENEENRELVNSCVARYLPPPTPTFTPVPPTPTPPPVQQNNSAPPPTATPVPPTATPQPIPLRPTAAPPLEATIAPTSTAESENGNVNEVIVTSTPIP